MNQAFNVVLKYFLIINIIVLVGVLSANPQEDWLTYYEKSNYLETPRYPETIAYCKKLANASSQIQYTSFGKSPQGRDLPLVVLDKNGHFMPEAVRKSGNAIMLIQSCIHAGESDGKDASLMLMREIAITKTLTHLLDDVTVLFIPIFNVDGHEIFGPYNRMNQNGPKEMGFRATATNYNLNRDFLKAETPEMQAWIKLYNRWLPDFLVDNHVTDGADHQYHITYGLEAGSNVAEPLRKWSTDVLAPQITKAMAKENAPIFPYFSLKKRPDPKNGLLMQSYNPRYSNGFGMIQNRVFFLVEAHMLKNYKTRVTANYHLLKHLIGLVGEEKENLLKLNQLSDQITAENFAGTTFPLNYNLDMKDSLLTPFLGVEYEIVHSEISNSNWVKYGTAPKNYQMPVFQKQVVRDSAKIPHAYIIPPQWQSQIQKLAEHGVKIDRLKKDVTLTVKSYQFSNASWGRQPFEGHHLVAFEHSEITEERFYPAGSAIIKMDQRTNRLIAHLLEPHAPDSFVRWGLWNTIFEQKEYGEDYVLEATAREMLKKDPALQAEFDAALEASPNMAANRWARLYFFYARTPYWENRINIYPVGKIMEESRLKALGF